MDDKLKNSNAVTEHPIGEQVPSIPPSPPPGPQPLPSTPLSPVPPVSSVTPPVSAPPPSVAPVVPQAPTAPLTAPAQPKVVSAAPLAPQSTPVLRQAQDFGAVAAPANPQPIPSDTLPRKDLEQKAKQMVKELNQISPPKETQLPKRSPMVAGLVVFLLVLVGAGGLVGMNLLRTEQSAEIRQQAAYNIAFTCTREQANQNLHCLNFPQETWKDGWCVLNICPDGDTTNDSGCSWDDRNVYYEFGHCFDYVIPKVKLLDPSVCYQYDTVISKTDLRWCDLTQPPSACMGYEANMATCRPMERPTICESSTISGTGLKPGESLSVTVKSKVAAKKYQIGFYNLDNLYGPDNPKGFMPVANQQLVMVKEAPSSVNEMTFTITYDDVHKPDLHPDWNGSIPTRFQLNAYVYTNEGKLSAPVPECVERFALEAPVPTATPMPSCSTHCTSNAQCPAGLTCVANSCQNPACPTAPGCACPSPTPTQQPLACTTIGFSNNNPNYGDTVTLTCNGSPAGSVGQAYFQVKRPGGDFTDLPNTTNTTAQLTIRQVGAYETRCRVCRTSDVSTCTDWQGATTQ